MIWNEHTGDTNAETSVGITVGLYNKVIMLWLSSCCHRNSYVTGHVKWFTWVRFPRGDLSYGLCVLVSVCVYPHILIKITCLQSLVYLTRRFLIPPHFRCEFIINLFLPSSVYLITWNTSPYIFTSFDSCHVSHSILSVLCQFLCLVHALPDKGKTPSPLCGCVYVHFPVSVLPCVWQSDKRWQWAMVLT